METQQARLLRRRTHAVSPGRGAPLVISCTVSSSWARSLSQRAVQAAGAVPIHVPFNYLSKPRSSWDISGVIYDLTPWNEMALSHLDTFRRSRPGVPVLLYLPAISRAVSLIPQCNGYRSMRLRMQEQDPQGMAGLASDIRWLVRTGPVHDVIAFLTSSVADLCPAAILMARHVLRHIAMGKRTSVTAAASALGLSRRTLERELKSRHSITPKEFADWTALLYLCFSAECGSTSLRSISRHLGFDPPNIYRLRSRLLSRAGGSEGGCRSAGTSARLAFVRRCGRLQCVGD